MNSLVKLLLACFLALVPLLGLAQEKGSYVLGPEDLVVVTVIGFPDFSGEFLIPESGEITLPVVGKVKVAGMTIDQLTATATEGMKKRLRRPEVTVSLKAARPRRVSVLGDVRSPGVFDLKSGWAISEALSAAGGLVVGIQARDVTVFLERGADKQRSTYALTEVLDDQAGKRVQLAAGDILRFEAAPLVAYQVSGRVKAPGQFRVRKEEASILSLLALAGGPAEDANLAAVKIIKADGTDRTIDLTPTLLRGESMTLPAIEPGDTILVTPASDRFVVLGHIRTPGYYPLPSGRALTLAEAISMASGGAPSARLSRIGLMRNVEGKNERRVYDLGKFLNSGDTSMNPVIKSGDVIFVPESNKVDLQRALGSLAAVTLIFTRLFP